VSIVYDDEKKDLPDADGVSQCGMVDEGVALLSLSKDKIETLRKTEAEPHATNSGRRTSQSDAFIQPSSMHLQVESSDFIHITGK
jgi:hypothetical protein